MKNRIPKPRQKHKIVFGLPTMSWGTNSILRDWMAKMYAAMMEERCPWIFERAETVNEHGIAAARNIICGMLRKHCPGADLMFIDADVGPPDNTIELFNVRDADIVCGIYPYMTGAKSGTQMPPVAYTVYDEDEPSGQWMPKLFGDFRGVLEADAAGTGLMLIKRHVIEDRRMWLTDEIDPDSGAVAVFQDERNAQGMLKQTDDLDFCKRAKALGYKLKVHTGVRAHHFKMVDIEDVARACESAYMAGLTNRAS